jgi:hypothetical protein
LEFPFNLFSISSFFFRDITPPGWKGGGHNKTVAVKRLV